MSRGTVRRWCAWGYLALVLTLKLAEAAGRNLSADHVRRKGSHQSNHRARQTSAETVLLRKMERQRKLRRRKVIVEVPFFTAHAPLKEHMKSHRQKHEVSFHFKAPRYLMMIHSAEQGVPLYGYTDEYPPRPGVNGTLILLHERYNKTGKVINWKGSKQKGPVAVWGQPGPQFRILNVSYKAVPGFEKWAKPEKIAEAFRRQQEEPKKQTSALENELPLFVGKVMLLPESDPRSHNHLHHARKTEEEKQAHKKKLELWDALMGMRVVTEEDDREGYLGPAPPVRARPTRSKADREIL
mmetsp:Transcript_39979/g.71971  ORF Transcript_39979/g.71971 Transcript_39979/m.71971 type:complete len:297 (-) Transcript_39979:108-998(-)